MSDGEKARERSAPCACAKSCPFEAKRRRRGRWDTPVYALPDDPGQGLKASADCVNCQRASERDKLLLSAAETLARVAPGHRFWIGHELAQKIRQHIIMTVYDE